MTKNTEILAPAGSYESLVAAVNAGADAVYIGGARFGARASAASVSTDEDIIISGINYAHHFGVKVYLTVNVLLKEKETNELYDYILPYYKAGIDALIVQDLGVLRLLHLMFPEVEKHASTQLSIQGFEAVDILREYGVTRIVPARELSLSEIKDIYDRTKIEIESFVHGALCYSYSGQCLMSSLIGGRSGNRGRCAQTCRLDYDLYDKNDKKLNKNNEKNLLSCKDLCALDVLPDIIEAGVYSLKIEGRMKSPIYTAGVVSIWKKYVDMFYKNGKSGYKVDERDKRLLLDLFDRGGHTGGYFKAHNTKDMIAVCGKPKLRVVNEEFNSYLEETYVKNTRKIKLKAFVSIKENEEMKLVIRALEDIPGFLSEISAQVGMPAKADKKAAVKEDIEKQILKTGNTLYEFSSLEIQLDEGLFVPVKQLNELRRSVLEKADAQILSFYTRGEGIRIDTEAKKPEEVKNCEPKILHLFCEEEEQLFALIEVLKKHKNKAEENNFGFEVSYQADTTDPKKWKKINSEFKNADIGINLYMPHIFRTEARKYFEKYKDELLKAGFDAVVARTVEEFVYIKNIFKDEDIDCILDYTLYGMNRSSQKFYEALGAKRQTLPVELNLSELKGLETGDKELVIYGHLPMMVTAGCLRKNILSCDKVYSLLYLKDRMGKNMPVKNRCHFCYNTILNSSPLSTLGISESIEKLNVLSYRLMFTVENKNELTDILNAYIKCFIYKEKCDEISKDFTRGHFKRGID